jgi:hypothetical protein
MKKEPSLRLPYSQQFSPEHLKPKVGGLITGSLPIKGTDLNPEADKKKLS